MRRANIEFAADAVALTSDSPHKIKLHLEHDGVSSRTVTVSVTRDYRTLAWEVSGGKAVLLEFASTGAGDADYQGKLGDFFLPSDVAFYVMEALLS